MAAAATTMMQNLRITMAHRFILLGIVLVISTTGANFCFRKYSADYDACKGQIRSHGPIDAEACCSKDGLSQGKGFALQLMKHPGKNGKKWFSCVACTSPSMIARPHLVSNATADNIANTPQLKYFDQEVDRMLLSYQPSANSLANKDEQFPDVTNEEASSRRGHLPNDLLGGAAKHRKSEMQARRLAFSGRSRWQKASSDDNSIDSSSSPLSIPRQTMESEWSQWSEWGPCSTTCGITGRQQRTRFCLMGNCYDGMDFEDRSCTDTKPCPVNGGWGQWTEWSTCDLTCNSYEDKNSASQSRYRSCNNPAPAYGGLDCIGTAEEFKKCDELPLCPVDGEWSVWTNWTTCSTSCGEGLQTRSRQCDNPMPRHGGRPCEGLELESAPCIVRPDCPVNGQWSDWSRMELCSAKPCSGQRGFRIKFRSCTSPRPSLGGMPCRGRSWIREPCYNNDFCSDSVNGGWCPWLDWTTCNGNTEFQTRERNCSCPPPVNGGMVCQGDNLQSKKCKTMMPTTINLADKLAGKYSNDCHGEASGDGSDTECDTEQEDLVSSDDEGSATD